MALPRQKLTFERIRKFALSEGKTQAFLWDAGDAANLLI